MNSRVPSQIFFCILKLDPKNNYFQKKLNLLSLEAGLNGSALYWKMINALGHILNQFDDATWISNHEL